MEPVDQSKVTQPLFSQHDLDAAMQKASLESKLS
jgi:hypothetical protein